MGIHDNLLAGVTKLAKNENRFVYVVGAGLSSDLGFPTISSLLPNLWPRLEKAQIAADIADVIRFHHPDFNPKINETYPTIEELLSEINANADLFDSTRPAVGGFTSEQLEERRGNLLQEMATWFHEIKTKALKSKPRWLMSLVDTMKSENAVIISFNWDLILDELLFGEKLDKSSYGLDRRIKGPRLIKPHGSLNWYKHDVAKPLSTAKKFSLIGRGDSEVLAFRPLRAPKSNKGRRYMPLIVPPTYAKQFEGPLFRRLWQETVRALSTATEVRFLGYSLAEADFHARFVLRCGFYNQEHGELTSSSTRKPPSGRAKVVVVDPSKSSQKRIRDTVGWECHSHTLKLKDWISGPG